MKDVLLPLCKSSALHGGLLSFFERLEQRCKEVDSILCVGLDPHRQDLETLGDVSAEGAFTFATNLIDQTKHIAVA